MSKIRLDHLLQTQFPQYSRRQIQSWIMLGRVSLNGKILDKAG
jgi:RNA-binding protein YlmH